LGLSNITAIKPDIINRSQGDGQRISYWGRADPPRAFKASYGMLGNHFLEEIIWPVPPGLADWKCRKGNLIENAPSVLNISRKAAAVAQVNESKGNWAYV